MKPLGLYLHIPFCRSKCHYCDFYSAVTGQEARIGTYAARLCADLTARATDCRDYVVDSVYIGGGTPTVLSESQLRNLLETVYSHYHLTPDCEITMECNPTTADGQLLAAARRAGVNRLSVGLQSAQDKELALLGRSHTCEDFLKCWDVARKAGFSNISADVMFGIPGQTPKSFRNTLETVLSLSPEHLSAYALSVEKGTRFGKSLPAPLPEEEDTAQMYLDMIDLLAERGLGQYEISNFAKPGYRSRHNLKYWNAGEYLGFGPAAHSDFGGERFGNSRNTAAYLRGEPIRESGSRPDRTERENEYVMLRMRLSEGLDGELFRAKFGHGADVFFGCLEPYVAGGFVMRTERGMAFTPKGFLVSNTILSEVVDFTDTNGVK